MSLRVSTAKGRKGSKKPPQKHQNTFAYTTNKHSFIAQKIAALPVHGLCPRCLEIIQWKKRMNKYKPLTQPKKCVECLQKKVKDAYHVLCDCCAEKKGVCAKCQLTSEIVDTATKTHQEVVKEEQEKERILESLNERQRRSYQRKLEKGEEEEAQKFLIKCVENSTNLDDFDFEDDFEDLKSNDNEEIEDEDEVNSDDDENELIRIEE